MNLLATSVQEKRAVSGVQRWLLVSFANWGGFWLSCFGCIDVQGKVGGNAFEIRCPTPSSLKAIQISPPATRLSSCNTC